MNPLPILYLSSKNDVSDPTIGYASPILKVLFVSVHDDSSRKDLLDSFGGAEIAFQLLRDSFKCVFGYLDDH